MEHPEGDGWVPTVLAAWAEGQRISAVGPTPLEHHLDHARRLSEVLGPGGAVALDLGTGAGIPGLALAGFRPDLRWTLVDAARRRLRPVRAAVDQLGWADRVAVVHARAEELASDDRWVAHFDVIVARLFGPPAVTAECAAPLLRRGGRLLVTEPPGGAPGRWDDPGLAALGLERRIGHDDPPVVELVSVAAPEDRFPRRPGQAVRRPLW